MGIFSGSGGEGVGNELEEMRFRFTPGVAKGGGGVFYGMG